MKITRYLIGGLAALALVGCKDKMRELNTNPNTIGSADPRYMFLSAVQDFDFSGNRGYIQDNYGSTGVLMQYFVYYTGAQDGTYCNEQKMSYSSPGTIGYNYDWLYSVGYKLTSLISYIDQDLDAVKAPQYQDLRAMCGVLRVYEAFRVFQNYGAAIYSQAFLAIKEGITLPEYDIFDNKVYEMLDDELKGYIAVLEQPANANTVDMAGFDPIYGYTVSSEMGAPSARGNYTEQRTLWKKFANSYRLYMAWVMKSVDPSRFTTVLSETMASGLYESAADGAFSYLNGSNQNSGIYNSNGPNEVSIYYSVSDNFISYLKELDDPRLPLLARSNSLYDANKDLKWIRTYYPDSLQYHWYYDATSKQWDYRSWNGVFDFDADPLLAYQGVSPNPADYDKSGPEQFWGERVFTLRFYAPGYKPNEPEFNKTLIPWTVTNPNDPSDTYTVKTVADTSFSLTLGSRPQGRYFVASGGKSFSMDNNGGNGYDGPVSDWSKIFMRRPVYTYPEFCFMMAYLTVDGVNTGKAADLWYTEGITAAMQEVQGDAVRYGVQVATNKEHTYYTDATGTVYVNPEIVGINDNGLYDITGKIAGYVTSHALANAPDQKEAIAGQMWIYCYNQPQKMWDWWRLTGYPKIVTVADPANRPNNLYWAAPTTRGGANALKYPRRGSLPTAEAANNKNYNAARDALLNNMYGTIYNQTTGRIYWDTQGWAN